MDISSKQLIEGWRNGDDSAAVELFDRYFGRLLGLVDSHLAQVFRSRFDAADVCQSTLRSVFRRTKETKYSFDHDGGVWRFMAEIALNKLRNRCRREAADRRDIRRELSQQSEGDAPGDLFFGLSREPSSEDVAEFRNLLDVAMQRLSPEERRYVSLQLRGGYSQGEIAKKLNLSTRTVRRLPLRIRKRLGDLFEGGKPSETRPEVEME